MNVGEVAALAGVTVRTLHHWDRIGLLSPSDRTQAGYRRYAPADLDRLHQVLLYRALGFSLEEVATLLDDPSADPAEHLRRQHRLLLDRLDRTSAMVAAVEKELEARAMGISLSPEERFEVFGEQDPAQYDAEVEERWGDTEAYAQSRRRTAAYTKEDWLRIRAEAEDLEARFAAALADGAAADSERAMDLAEEHRRQIDGTYYDCPPAMHAALGRMYVEDERFAAHYDGRAPGLARYVSTAVQANAARQA
jgi:DNA-binding transcriptional MerR regulator